jgi:hypothetical protein
MPEKKPKPKPIAPFSDAKGDVRAAEMRNKGVARIGDTPLADAGVVRTFPGKKSEGGGTFAMGLEPGAYNTMAPGKYFASNMKNSKDPFSPTRLIRENRAAYGASLPGSKNKSATANALAMAKARKKGAK